MVPGVLLCLLRDLPGAASLYINGKVIANMSKANFKNTTRGIPVLKAGGEVSLTLSQSMGYSLFTGAYDVIEGPSIGD
jgi:beta-glucosidase